MPASTACPYVCCPADDHVQGLVLLCSPLMQASSADVEAEEGDFARALKQRMVEGRA
jgi:hypothetical protein